MACLRGSARVRTVFAATCVVAAAIVLVLVPAAASRQSATPAACTINWDGGAGTTSWTDAANWDTDSLPGPADDVCISAGAPGASVTYSDAVNTQVSSLSSGKPLGVSLGVVTVAGPATLETLTLSGGTVSLNGSTAIGALDQSDGLLTGSGAVGVGAFHWTGGAQSGTGTTTVSSSGLGLTIDGAAAKTLQRDLVSNDPAGLWDRGTIDLSSGGRIVNNGTLHVNAGEVGDRLTSSDHSGTLVDVGRLELGAGITISARLQDASPEIAAEPVSPEVATSTVMRSSRSLST